MYLRRIALEHFGTLGRKVYTFEPGFNLIKGPNEAGKSTLQTAILFGLFGNPQHTTLQRIKHVDDYISWGASRPFTIVLDITDEKGKFFRVKKDWASEVSEWTDMSSGEILEGIDAVQRRLDSMLGYGTIKVFQSTACIEQDTIDDLTSGRKKISDSLQSIVTGGGEEAEASNVLEKLQTEIAELIRGWQTYAPKNPGPIKRKKDRLEKIQSELSEARTQVRDLQKVEEQLSAFEGRLRAVDDLLKTKRALKQRCETKFSLEEELEEWRERESKLDTKIRRIRDVKNKLKEAEDNLGALRAFESLDEDREESLRDMRQRVLLLEEEVDRKTDKLKNLKKRPKREVGTRVRIPGALLAGVGIGVLLLLMGLLSHQAILAFLGILFIAGSFLWYVYILSQSRASELKSHVAAPKEKLSEEQDSLQDMREQLAEKLESFECATWNEFTQKRSDYRDYLKQSEQAQTRLDTLLEDSELEDLIDKRKLASRKRRDAEEALENPEMRKAAEVTPERYEELKQEIARLEEEKEKKIARFFRQKLAWRISTAL
jgi:DNA repair exonuclease SbcCD ATPase subunit